MGWNAFLDSAETRLAGVTGISYASRAAGLDSEKLLLIPRWPAALLIDRDGAADLFSGRITDRSFAVMLAVFVPRGTLGKEAARTLGTLSEAVVEEFTHTDEDNSIMVLSTSDEIAANIRQGEVYMRVLNFGYSLLR